MSLVLLLANAVGDKHHQYKGLGNTSGRFWKVSIVSGKLPTRSGAVFWVASETPGEPTNLLSSGFLSSVVTASVGGAVTGKCCWCCYWPVLLVASEFLDCLSRSKWGPFGRKLVAQILTRARPKARHLANGA